tara:strand:- start:2565 stop:3071 length:507 start_codon:yes stop_codon:yes gene_type:complete
MKKEYKMNKYKTNRGRVVFVTLSFSIIAGLMILSANNNNVPELSYEASYEAPAQEVVLDERAEEYIAEAIEAIDVIIEENLRVDEEEDSLEPSTFNEAFSQARALLGSGHEFTWKGQEYTTSYAEELAANTTPVEEESDALESEDDGETKFTADDEEDVYSAVLESNN